MSDIIIFKVTGVLPTDIEVPGSEDFDFDYWVAYDTALEDIVVQGERRSDVVRELEQLGVQS